jgi:hypothetical protein
MRKLGLRAVIAGASVLTIMSAVDGADLLGQAHADPRCATSGADPCQPQADPPPQADPTPRTPTPDGDCLHWRGAEDRRSSLLASASTPRQPAALTARQRYSASTAYRCQPTTVTFASVLAVITVVSGCP